MIGLDAVDAGALNWGAHRQPAGLDGPLERGSRSLKDAASVGKTGRRGEFYRVQQGFDRNGIGIG